MILGTADYLAPARRPSEPPWTPAAASTPLGVVLYEMLAGVVPFAGRTPLQAHGEEEPPPLPERVPPTIRAPVMRVLQEQPAARFPSVTACADALAL